MLDSKSKSPKKDQKDEEEEELKIENTGNKTIDIKSKKISKLNGTKSDMPSYLDELFFYYFEELLARKIESIFDKKHKTQGRGRFMSEDNYKY